MTIKQLFCKHIYTIEREDYLYTTYRRLDEIVLRKWRVYAIYWKCIKCGKQKTTEHVRPKDK